MNQRSSLRHLGATLGLAVAVGACGGMGSGRLTDRAGGAGPMTSPESSPAGGPGSTPAGGASTAGTPAPRPAGTESISTTDALDLLRQVDDLLRQADGELAAALDAATTMGE